MFTVRKGSGVRVMFHEVIDASPRLDGVGMSTEERLVGRVKRELVLVLQDRIKLKPLFHIVSLKIAQLLEPEIVKILMQQGAKNGHQMQAIADRLKKPDITSLIEEMNAPGRPVDHTHYPWGDPHRVAKLAIPANDLSMSLQA